MDQLTMLRLLGGGLLLSPTFALVGDSLTQYGNDWVTLNTRSLTRDAAGVVTVNLPNHGIYGSQPIYIVNISDTSYEAFATTTYIDVNNFSYPTGIVGLPGVIAGTSLSAVVIQNRTKLNGHFAWLNASLNGSAILVGNYGQGGDQSSDMTNAVALACASTANFVVLLDGTNDINTYSVTGATVVARTQVHVNTILAAGKKAVVVGITPLGVAFNSAAKNTEIVAANAGFAAMEAANPNNVLFASAHSLLTDGLNNNQAYAWATFDGIHWGHRAAKLVGEAIYAKVLSKILAKSILPNSAIDMPLVGAYQAIKQYTSWDGVGGGFAGTGVSGTIGANLLVFGSSALTTTVGSMVSRGAGNGYYQRLVITPGGANHSVTIYFGSNNEVSLATLGLTTADEIFFAMELSVSNALAVSLEGPQLHTGKYGTTIGYSQCGALDTGPSLACINDAYADKVIVTGPLKLNANYTGIVSSVDFRFPAAVAAAVTIDIGRIILFKKV